MMLRARADANGDSRGGPEDREWWDRDTGRSNEDFQRVESVIEDMLDGRLANPRSGPKPYWADSDRDAVRELCLLPDSNPLRSEEISPSVPESIIYLSYEPGGFSTEQLSAYNSGHAGLRPFRQEASVAR
jgi:hypothetical protein